MASKQLELFEYDIHPRGMNDIPTLQKLVKYHQDLAFKHSLAVKAAESARDQAVFSIKAWFGYGILMGMLFGLCIGVVFGIIWSA